eukprot:2699587-Amphidinium_carterae.2
MSQTSVAFSDHSQEHRMICFACGKKLEPKNSLDNNWKGHTALVTAITFGYVTVHYSHRSE